MASPSGNPGEHAATAATERRAMDREAPVDLRTAEAPAHKLHRGMDNSAELPTRSTARRRLQAEGKLAQEGRTGIKKPPASLRSDRAIGIPGLGDRLQLEQVIGFARIDRSASSEYAPGTWRLTSWSAPCHLATRPPRCSPPSGYILVDIRDRSRCVGSHLSDGGSRGCPRLRIARWKHSDKTEFREAFSKRRRTRTNPCCSLDPINEFAQ